MAGNLKFIFLRRMLLIILMVMSGNLFAGNINITNDELNDIGNKIFNNECAGKISNLTHWNKGEYFASLGIGHFIWYPADKSGPFGESFPKLLAFFKGNGMQLPGWLQPDQHCPWNDRKEFYKNYNSSRMCSLRNLLQRTQSLQIKFIANRMITSLPEMLNVAPVTQRRNVYKQFNRMLKTPMGLYPLIDYVNFKGEGVLASERYKGQGWGLLQVLENMKGTKPGAEALKEFAESADFVLTRRVKNSSNKAYEQKWLPGWRNRINTYTQED